jgi:hypothetical protein
MRRLPPRSDDTGLPAPHSVTALDVAVTCGGLALALWATWDRANGFIYLLIPLVLGTAAPLLSMLAVAYVAGRRARSALGLRLRGRFLLELGTFALGAVIPLQLVVTYRTVTVAVAGVAVPAFFVEGETFPRFVGIYALPITALVILALGLRSRSALPRHPHLSMSP